MVTTMTRPPAQTPPAQQIARMDAGRLRAYRENLEFYQGAAVGRFAEEARAAADAELREDGHREDRFVHDVRSLVRGRPGGRVRGGGGAGEAGRARAAGHPRGEQPRSARVRQRDRLLGARRRGVQGDLGPRGEASAHVRAGRAGALRLAVGR